MAEPSRDVTVAGLPALSTGPWASSLADAVPVSLMRAVMPTRITAIAATSDTATIFRWVVRSAVTSEWFMGSLPRFCSFVVVTGRLVQPSNADSCGKFHFTVRGRLQPEKPRRPNCLSTEYGEPVGSRQGSRGHKGVWQRR